MHTSLHIWLLQVFRLLMKTDVLVSSCLKAFSNTRACATGTDGEFDALLERGVAKGKSLFKDVYLLSQLLNHYVNPHKKLCVGPSSTAAGRHAGMARARDNECGNGFTDGSAINGNGVQHDCNGNIGKPGSQMMAMEDVKSQNGNIFKYSSGAAAAAATHVIDLSPAEGGLNILSKVLGGHRDCTKPCMVPLYSKVPFISLGNFMLFYRINEGSSGKVHVGFHKMHRRTYALKVIRKAQFNGERTLFKRLKDEMSLSTALNHPNVVRTFELLETKSTLIIAMEYCDGGDLIGIIKEYSPMSEQMARTIFRMVVNGVHYLHLTNICHRDIKPENIFLKRVPVRTEAEGPYSGIANAKIAPTTCDNGLLKANAKNSNNLSKGMFKSLQQAVIGVEAECIAETATQAPTNCRLSNSETSPSQSNVMSYIAKVGDLGAATRITGDRTLLDTVGTMSYAAPEVLGCGGIVGYCGKQADIWSLGVLLYAMLFGELPWVIEKVPLRDAVQSIVGQSLCFPSDVSPSAVNLMNGMLHINPSKRMTVEEVMAHPWLMEGTFEATLNVKKIRSTLSRPI